MAAGRRVLVGIRGLRGDRLGGTVVGALEKPVHLASPDAAYSRCGVIKEYGVQRARKVLRDARPMESVWIERPFCRSTTSCATSVTEPTAPGAAAAQGCGTVARTGNWRRKRHPSLVTATSASNRRSAHVRASDSSS